MLRALIVSLFVVGTASAQNVKNDISSFFVTGNELVEICALEDTRPCQSYIMGVVDANVGLNAVGYLSTGAICLPDNVTSEQTMAMVNKYLKERPNILHHAAANLVAGALYDNFGCRG